MRDGSGSKEIKFGASGSYVRGTREFLFGGTRSMFLKEQAATKHNFLMNIRIIIFKPGE